MSSSESCKARVAELLPIAAGDELDAPGDSTLLCRGEALVPRECSDPARARLDCSAPGPWRILLIRSSSSASSRSLSCSASNLVFFAFLPLFLPFLSPAFDALPRDLGGAAGEEEAATLETFACFFFFLLPASRWTEIICACSFSRNCKR